MNDIMPEQTFLLNDPVGKNWKGDKLAERFVIPPFSVLDTKQGIWQDRRRSWLELGIQSELGRENRLIFKSSSGAFFDFYKKKEEYEEKVGYKVTTNEFHKILKGNSKTGLLFKAQDRLNEIMKDKRKNRKNLLTDMIQREDEIKDIKLQGTSVFDPVLSELCYRWFCPRGGIILDPFAGGSVRGVVASVLGYGYIGIELRPEQVDENDRQIEEIKKKRHIENPPRWIIGDSARMDDFLDIDEFDFIFSCPPYYNLEVYSNLLGELSNFGTYKEFREIYGNIINKSVNRLKNNRFACFVVSNIRDENGYYRRFVCDTIDFFEKSGAKFYNDMILLNAIGTLPIRVSKSFNVGRKVGRCHQNVLVFYKGNAKEIRDIFEELNELEKQSEENIEEVEKYDNGIIDENGTAIEPINEIQIDENDVDVEDL